MDRNRCRAEWPRNEDARHRGLPANLNEAQYTSCVVAASFSTRSVRPKTLERLAHLPVARSERAGPPVVRIVKIPTLVGLLVLMTNIVARADPSYVVWRLAHERLLAKWRASEPRCGWTAGGYACASRKRSGYGLIWIRR